MSAVVAPSARKSRISDTQMRWPRMQGFPKHTFGSIVIRFRSSSFVIADTLTSKHSTCRQNAARFGTVVRRPPGPFYSPDYLREDRTMRIETNLYATATPEGEFVSTGISDSFNPSSAAKAIDAVVKVVVKELEKEGISKGRRLLHDQPVGSCLG